MAIHRIKTKFVPIYESINHNIAHLDRFGQANGFARQALDTGPQSAVFVYLFLLVKVHVIMVEDRHSFAGNKAALPRKVCVVCGREMTWRKKWARNWDQVKYCSERCRRSR